jgi:predicted SnoaL-like aldol condensation-catalyzing enzyme
MHYLIKVILLALSLAAWAPTAQGYLSLADPVLGVLQQKPYCPARPASPEWQRAALYEFVSEIFFEVDGVQTSFDNFISPDYIQHSPFLEAHGRNSTLSVLLNAFGGVNITILQIMFDSPYGMIHYKFAPPTGPPLAFMDLWRFNGTCMEEHWDVIQSLPANTTNPIALFK